MKKRVIRVVLLTLIVALGNQIIAPTVALALTSGPTSPEATSFEPIDTTDMVNPVTGDFTYNLPLLEVPGPEGGYPLSLSYHAGIQPNEDASWVGLGWTLNPGAITRNVNGFPDDWYNTNSSRRDYWAGGVQKTYGVGVSVGLGGAAGNVSLGLSFSQDTYRGFGVGASLGAGIGMSKDFGANASIGISPFGDIYSSAGINANLGSLSVGLGIGSTNFESLSTYGSLGINGSAGNTLLGVSIASNSTSPSFSVGGTSGSFVNSKAGNISTSSSGFSIGIPIAPLVSVNLSYSKVRYWSDETSIFQTHGSLHSLNSNTIANDTYSLLDTSTNAFVNPDPNKVQGGSYPDYDFYSISAQGLGGNIRPYNFQSQVYTQNRKDNNDVELITYFHTGITQSPDPVFRFINDFSNSYRQNYNNYSNANLDLKSTMGPFDNAPVYGNNDGAYGYENGNNLSGSRHIKHFTTADLTGSPSGFISPTVIGLDRSLHIGSSISHIEGFAITNANGITYHYNLPAYSYDEEMYQEKIGGNPVSYNRQTKAEGYAYTWYLTSVTGPDYVDRNSNQKVDAGDWGYWVNFEYGKFSDNYIWRNPSEGFHRDEDNEFQNVSMGKKEIYYLNAIRTRSHIAIFEKDERPDARGASNTIFGKQSNGTYSVPNGAFDASSAKSLRLSKIYLLNAEDANFVNASASGTGFAANILDKSDVNAVGRSALEAKSLRIINLNHDFGLCKGTSNSFNDSNINGKLGKLSLNSLIFRGQGGLNLTPPMEFEYGLSSNELKSSTGVLSPSTFVSNSALFEIGDLVETDEVSSVYCGVIASKQLNGSSYTYTLLNGQYTGGAATKQLRATKNPPYNKNAYDMWGMYKSDYENLNNENLSRLTSETSNIGTDAWSLRRVKTSLGSEIIIDYEGDTYSKSVLNENLSMIINSFTKVNDTSWILHVNTGGKDLTKLFSLGQDVDFLALLRYTRPPIVNNLTYTPIGTNITIGAKPYVEGVTNNQLQIKVSSSLNTALGGVGVGIHDLLTGNLKVLNLSRYYGGGIRVKTIKTDDLASIKYCTRYTYSNPLTLLSSGVTSYEPTILDIDNVAQYGQTAKELYRSKLYAGLQPLYQIAREVPAPGVMYEYVTVQSEVQHLGQSASSVPGKTVYQYEVFRDNMVGRIEATPAMTGTYGGKTQYTKNWVLKKFIGNLGGLKRISTYDPLGKKISEVTNNYLHDGLEDQSFSYFMEQYELRLAQFGYQGLLKERHSEVKEVRESNGAYTVRGTMSGREEYPAIPTGQTTVNYVTGTTTSTVNRAFDFYSGALTEMLYTDPYNNKFLTVIQPAYRKYSNNMGLKTKNSSYLNMLSQEAAKTTYQLNVDGSYNSVLEASVQTWANDVRVDDQDGSVATQGQNKIWRPKSSYQWLTTGTSANNLTPIASFIPFSFSSANGTSWKKTAEVSRYNMYSAALEASDFNSHFNSKKMGYHDTKVVISSSLARFSEIAYAGAEDPLLPNGKLSSGVNLGSGVITSSTAHTGSNSISLPGNTTGITYQVPISTLDPVKRDYAIMVWVKAGGSFSNARLFYQIDNQTAVLNVPSFQKSAAGWYLLEMKIPLTALASGTNITVGCKNIGSGTSINFDDFRFQPFNSVTNSYVYNKFTGRLTHIIDNNNLYERYGYDPLGRLINVYKEVLGKPSVALVKEIGYNYGKPIVPLTN